MTRRWITAVGVNVCLDCGADLTAIGRDCPECESYKWPAGFSVDTEASA